MHGPATVWQSVASIAHHGWSQAVLVASSLLAVQWSAGDLAIWVQAGIGLAVALVLGLWAVIGKWDIARRQRSFDEQAFRFDLALKEIEHRKKIDIEDAASLTAQVAKLNAETAALRANLLQAQTDLRQMDAEKRELEDELQAANESALRANRESFELLKQAQQKNEERRDNLIQKSKALADQISQSGQQPTIQSGLALPLIPDAASAGALAHQAIDEAIADRSHTAAPQPATESRAPISAMPPSEPPTSDPAGL